MTKLCPRCEAETTKQVHAGLENGAVLWRVFHCDHCAFTWRDSEPEASINPKRRPEWAQLKDVDLNGFKQIIKLEITSGGEG